LQYFIFSSLDNRANVKTKKMLTTMLIHL